MRNEMNLDDECEPHPIPVVTATPGPWSIEHAPFASTIVHLGSFYVESATGPRNVHTSIFRESVVKKVMLSLSDSGYLKGTQKDETHYFTSSSTYGPLLGLTTPLTGRKRRGTMLTHW